MWDSDACWKTVSDVTNGLKRLKYQKDKFEALRNNILIRYKGFQWDDWKTQWSRDGKKLSVLDLTKRLKDLIKKQIYVKHHNIELCMNTMFVNESGMLTAIDRTVRF